MTARKLASFQEAGNCFFGKHSRQLGWPQVLTSNLSLAPFNLLKARLVHSVSASLFETALPNNECCVYFAMAESIIISRLHFKRALCCNFFHHVVENTESTPKKPQRVLFQQKVPFRHQLRLYLYHKPHLYAKWSHDHIRSFQTETYPDFSDFNVRESSQETN